MGLPAHARFQGADERLRRVASRIVAGLLGLALLLTATPSGAGGPAGTFALARLNDGTAARWEPCRTVTYSVDPKAAPTGALADLQQALRLTAAATGLEFTRVAGSSEVPQQSWLRPGGWPDGTADLVVAWAVPRRGGTATRTSDLLGPDGPAGVGGWHAEQVTTPAGPAGRIVHAYVLLDAESDERFAPGFRPAGSPFTGRRPPRGRLLLHELGHALGLAHVDDEQQVMHPHVQPVKGGWAGGDLAGLRALRSGAACRDASALGGPP